MDCNFKVGDIVWLDPVQCPCDPPAPPMTVMHIGENGISTVWFEGSELHQGTYNPIRIILDAKMKFRIRIPDHIVSLLSSKYRCGH